MNKIYALANVYDPIIADRFEPISRDFKSYEFSVFANDRSLKIEDVPSKFNTLRFPANFVFALVESGEIGYTATGKFPIRKYHAV